MRRLAIVLLCIFLILIPIASADVTVQITVYCNGAVSYDNAVTVTKSNPTAFDAIKASGVAYTGDDWGSWGYFLTSIAGCGGSWGPAFYVNFGESSLGISGYQIEDGDQLQFIGPNGENSLAGYLYLEEVPSIVQKGQGFRIKVMEKSAYSYGGYDRPSSGATVTVGNESFETGGDGYTPEITLDMDAYFCVAAEKGGYIPTYWNFVDELPSIQCGIGGPYICAITGGVRRGNFYYDETSSISGQGFSLVRSNFENLGRSAKVYQKGSGEYSVEKIITQKPSKIDISESTEMRYNTSAFKAYNRTLSYASKFEDSLREKSYLEGSTYEEIFRQLDYINREGVYNNTDKIRFFLESDFAGMAELYSRALDKDAFLGLDTKAEPIEESLETYIGSFQILRRGEVPLLNTTGGEDDCEKLCKKNCTEACEDLRLDCESYCDDYCDDYCENQTIDEYDSLPCCTGGWNSMARIDQIGYSANGVFDCSCNKMSMEPITISQAAIASAVGATSSTSAEQVQEVVYNTGYLSSNNKTIAAATNYLISCQNEDGGFGQSLESESDLKATAMATIALASLGKDPTAYTNNGKSPLDYLLENREGLGNLTNVEAQIGRYVVAIVSAGLDPWNAGGTDYAYILKSYCSPNGEIGKENYIWDDAWVVMGLAASNQSGSDEVKRALIHLKGLQTVKGGWAWNGGLNGEDPDTTSIILCALISGGEESGSASVKKALEYLHFEQNKDGGFSSLGSNAATDGWAIMALNAVGQNPREWKIGSNDPIGHLLSLQKEDGSFWWKQDSQGMVFEWTANGIVALIGGTMPPI